MELSATPLVPAADDIGLLCQVIASATSERVLTRLDAAGYGDVRFSHGYVFQGVLAGDTTITQLARRLGVSVQAVSKSVTELEEAGYLHRRRDARDGRARPLELTRRGQSLLAVSRQARLEIADDIANGLGGEAAHTLVTLLRAVAARYGGLATISTRRLRPAEGL